MHLRCLCRFILFATLVPCLAHGDNRGSIQDVRIVNLPQRQFVEGEVKIKGGLRSSKTVRREQLIVSPVPRSDTDRLIEVQPLDSDGFTSAIFNLQGEVKSESFLPGEVGVLLLPDEKPVMQAFLDERRLLFPLEVKTMIKPVPYRYFSAETSRKTIGFPRYRIFLYNETDKAVELNLYIYLTQ